MDVVNRLKYFMDSTGITISQFADTCSIPRPTMSQLMSGRNKRISNEIFDKIHNGFPQLSIMWLMFGEGMMLPHENTQFSEPQNSRIDDISSTENLETNQFTSHQSTLFSVENSAQSVENSSFTDQNEDFFAPAPTMTASGANISEISDETPAEDSPIQKNNFTQTAATVFPASTATPAESAVTSHATSPYTNQPDAGILFDEISYGTHTPQTPYSSGHQAPDNSRTQPAPSSSITDRDIAPETHERAHVEANRVSIAPDARKKITNIVVFYSDNSFQSFLPDL